MADYVYYTKEGLDDMRKELNNLETHGRKEVAKQIAEARDKGDLSENAEYDAAKEAQGLLELKINKLKSLIAKARILDKTKIDTSKVSILSKVKIRNEKNKREVVYELVPQRETNLKEGKISVDSPIGKGLLGKKVGEQAAIKTPSGIIQFSVLEINL